MQITEKMASLIRRKFEQADADAIIRQIIELDEEDFGGQDSDRIVAAIVILAMNNIANLSAIIGSARTDWRDLLMGAGLADDDWPLRIAEI